MYYPNGTQSEDPLNDSCDFFLTTLLKSIIETFYYSVKTELQKYNFPSYDKAQALAMLDRIDAKTASTYNEYMGEYQEHHDYYLTFVLDVDVAIKKIQINLTESESESEFYL